MKAKIVAGKESSDLTKIVEFLENWVREKHSDLSFFSEHAKYYSPDLMTLPAVAGRAELGAYERAELMQQAEDAWNYQEPAPRQQILLVPARPSRRVIRKERKGKNHAI